jgi:hypothetical protein
MLCDLWFFYDYEFVTSEMLKFVDIKINRFFTLVTIWGIGFDLKFSMYKIFSLNHYKKQFSITNLYILKNSNLSSMKFCDNHDNVLWILTYAKNLLYNSINIHNFTEILLNSFLKYFTISYGISMDVQFHFQIRNLHKCSTIKNN